MTNKRDVIDKPFSWLIATMSCLNVIMFYGFLKSGGVFLVGLHQTLNVSRSDATLITLTSYGAFFGVGSFGGFLSHVVGYRTILFIGAIISAVGMFASSFIQDTKLLILTLGFLQGAGFGLTFVPNISVISYYFEKHRGKAFSLNLAGGPLGSIIFPPIIQYLFDEYGVKGTFFISSAIILNMIAFSIILKPPEKSNSDAEEEDNRKMTLVEIFKFLLTNKFFYLVIFSVLTTNYSLMIFTLTYPDHSTLHGLNPSQGAFLISVNSIVDLIARLSTGVLIDMKIIRSSFSYAIAMICCACSLIFAAFIGNASYGVFAFASGLYGLCFGASNVHFPIIIGNFVNRETLPMSISGGFFLSFLSAFCSSPLVDIFMKTFKSYSGIYLVCAAMYTFFSCTWTIIGYKTKL